MLRTRHRPLRELLDLDDAIATEKLGLARIDELALDLSREKGRSHRAELVGPERAGVSPQPPVS